MAGELKGVTNSTRGAMRNFPEFPILFRFRTLVLFGFIFDTKTIGAMQHHATPCN